jgi:uncharacterized protein GlcG (DUF336 family)
VARPNKSIKHGRTRASVRVAHAPRARRLSPTLGVMRQVTVTCAFVMLAIAAARCDASDFAEALLQDEGHTLVLVRADGSRSSAPKLEDQDSFVAPAVASNHQYAGWLAMFPDRGASYSLPLYLVVTDTRSRVKRFSGGFGMVFSWCFAGGGQAVVYKSMFPHGVTPVGFEMRRISDGRLLRRILLEPIRGGMDEDETLAKRVPSWARCAQRTQTD